MVDEIDIKKPVLEQMVMSANNFVENCAPEEGLIIKQKLDNLHARYNQVGIDYIYANYMLMRCDYNADDCIVSAGFK